MMENPETIPFDIENVIARRARMGLVALATDHVIEHELFRLVNPIEGIQIYTTRIPMEPKVTPQSLHGMKQLLTNTAKTLLPGVSLTLSHMGVHQPV